MRRRDLTDRMPGHIIRHHTPRLDQPEQRHLHREQRRLRKPGPIQNLRLPAPHHLPQRRIELRQHPVQRPREHRKTPIQLPPHTQPLTPLPREQESQLPGAWRVRAEDVRAVFAVSEGGQCGQQLASVGGQQRGPVLEQRAGGGQRVRHVGELEPGPRVCVGEQASCLRPQGVRRPGGQQDRNGLTLDGRPSRGFLGRRCLLQDRVRVRPAGAERGDAHPARAAGVRPLGRFGQQPDRTGAPVHMGRRRVRVQGLRQQAVPHRLHHLDHPRRTRGGLGVPDVGLQGAEQQRTRPVLPVRCQQRLRLDRIAQRGARAVRLHRVDVGGRELGVGQRALDHPLLRRPVRRGEAVGRTVLVDRRAAEYGEHGVTAAARVREAFDHQHAHALGPARTVGVLGERLAAAVRRERALCAELHESDWGRHHGHAAGQRHRALPRPQRLRGQVEGDQRRRAGGVHRDGGALEPEGVRQPAGEEARRLRGLPPAEVLGQAVVTAAAADERSGVGPAQRGRVDPRPLQGFPGRFEYEALLRIHHQGLVRRDPEEAGIEVGRVVQEAAAAGDASAIASRVAAEKGVEVPASVHRHVTDGVGAGQDEFPEVFRRPHAAGEAAAHADDRDRVVGRTGGRRRRGDRDGPLAEQGGQQVVGQFVRGREVEYGGGGHAQSGGPGELVAQVDGGQGVEPEVPEGQIGLDGTGVGVPQHQGALLPHHGEQFTEALGFGQAEQPVPKLGRRGSLGARDPCDAGGLAVP